MAEIHSELNPLGPRRATAGAEVVSSHDSAVSWAAILAGAAGAAALALILLILGMGLGFSAISPWSLEGISATTFGFAAIIWLTFTQIAASGMGGYLAGRLRVKWTSVHADEVYFRDTAHGFLSWAVAALVSAAVLTSAAGSIVSGGVRAGAAVTGGAMSAVGTASGAAAGSAAMLATAGVGADEVGSTIEYFVDSLFRGDPAADTGRPAARQPSPPSPLDDMQNGEIGAAVQQTAEVMREIPVAEVVRIFARALRTDNLPQEDQRYVAGLIAQHTDISQQEAEQRVAEGFERVQTALNEAETRARELADEARKATAYGSLWMFISLLIGAFVASLMAVYGGRQRDA